MDSKTKSNNKLYSICFVILVIAFGFYQCKKKIKQSFNQIKQIGYAFADEGIKACGSDKKCFDDFLKEKLLPFCQIQDHTPENCMLMMTDFANERYRKNTGK